MTNRILISAIVLLSFQLQTFAQNTNTDYSERVRKNASKFHMNFTTGDFVKNAPMVNEKIYYDSDNTIVIGRDNFVKDISSFHSSFPDLTLRDRIIIVDENQAALLYIMQGTQTGPYGSIPASGNKINVYAAEFFTMDNNVLMKELLTISQYDQLVRQITGEEKIERQEDVKLLPVKKTNMAYKHLLKDKLDAYVQNFNTRDWNALAAMFADNAAFKISGMSYKNISAFINELKSIIQKVPDVTYHLIRNIVEGDRGAIAYEVNGTLPNSNKSDANRKSLQNVKQSIHFQFDKKGKITDMIAIYNSEDFNKQLK
ncbi:nuclear transport factor 2 family protein [Elizabethkingia occulta]|uniref:nuclear transport factor 2 family protein n=1 Tax=Elizabethkingia occulta TaxID=1867263 RepID=UPI00398C3316